MAIYLIFAALSNAGIKKNHFICTLKDQEIKSVTAVRTNLEEILEVKRFLKMSIGFKCLGPKVELRFCSFLGCVHFSTAGTDKEKQRKLYVSRR